MKFDNDDTKRDFKNLCDNPKFSKGFYTFPEDPRYFALFKSYQEVDMTIRDGRVDENFVLYIYDAENRGGSVVYKVYKNGVLGMHGNKDDLFEQKLLIWGLVRECSKQVDMYIRNAQFIQE